MTYEKAKAERILFANSDVITTSTSTSNHNPEDENGGCGGSGGVIVVGGGIGPGGSWSHSWCSGGFLFD